MVENAIPTTSAVHSLEFTDTLSNEDFKKNVCIPYFKDIYKV
ncbi:MAG: hypothetical protein ACMG6E_09855 [Candidatus Roizmanbacteria bacterium]